MRQRAFIVPLLSLALVAVACGDDASPDASTSDTASADTASPETGSSDTASSDGAAGVSPVVAGEAFPADRCEANKAAGTIRYNSGFDYAAAASILEVVVADQKGYFDELCLDVEITPSFSTANYPLVGSNEVQFASSGSFSELATQARDNEADLVALSVDGHVAIDVLMAKPDVAGLEALRDATIGIKGALPPAIAVMLKQEAGLVEGTDVQTVLLEGFDPTAHWQTPGLAALPGWRSNEPGALDRAGIAYQLFDPATYDIPGSFGLIYTNREFLDTHPTAAQDFMRATMRGLADAIADPAAAAAIAVERINGNGNPNFLSPEGETFRWTTDASSIVADTPAGSHIGVPVATELTAQIEAYAAVGVYGDAGAPDIEGRYDADLVAGLYADDGTVIWPS